MVLRKYFVTTKTIDLPYGVVENHMFRKMFLVRSDQSQGMKNVNNAFSFSSIIYKI